MNYAESVRAEAERTAMNHPMQGTAADIIKLAMVRVARNVETGRMWVNTYNQIPAGAPFGGYKESGIGRETHKSHREN